MGFGAVLAAAALLLLQLPPLGAAMLPPPLGEELPGKAFTPEGRIKEDAGALVEARRLEPTTGPAP